VTVPAQVLVLVSASMAVVVGRMGASAVTGSVDPLVWS